MKQFESNPIKIISKKLDEACVIEFGTRVVQKRDGGAIYPVYGGGGATFKMDTYNRENCLIVSRFAMSKQCVRFVEGKFYLNDSGLTVKPKNENELTQVYLDYLLLTLNDTIYSLSRGTAQRNLNVPKFRKLYLKYPNSIELQLHIANQLSKSESLIAQRKESIRLLDEFLKSMFLEMFGDPEKNPKNLPFTELEKLCAVIVDCPHSTPMKSEEATNFPCIRTSELTNGYISWDSMQYLDEDEYIKRTQRLIPEAGDIVYGREGTYGEAIRIPATHKFSLGQRTMLFRPDCNKTNSIFLWAMVRSEFVYRQAKKKNSGSTVGHVNVKDIKQFRVFNPPIELQNQFAQIIEKTEAIKTQYQQSLQELENLYGSLSQKAFKGELSIKDESLLMAAEPKSSYVAQSNIPDNKRGFAKQVLGGKIVSLFKDDNNFTHIKFQKLQYLAEQIAEENLLWNYYRQAAGPHDNKFKYSVIAKLNENKWFEERNYMFYPLQKANDVDRYYKNYFGNKSDRLNELFLLLKNATEKFCEAIATIYAVWNNQIILQLPYNKSEIKKAFFEWSNRKEIIFTEDEFEKALEWMKKHNIEPIGFGQLIKERTGKK